MIFLVAEVTEGMEDVAHEHTSLTGFVRAKVQEEDQRTDNENDENHRHSVFSFAETSELLDECC